MEPTASAVARTDEGRRTIGTAEKQADTRHARAGCKGASPITTRPHPHAYGLLTRLMYRPLDSVGLGVPSGEAESCSPRALRARGLFSCADDGTNPSRSGTAGRCATCSSSRRACVSRKCVRYPLRGLLSRRCHRPRGAVRTAGRDWQCAAIGRVARRTTENRVPDVLLYAPSVLRHAQVRARTAG
jgi:hypothetical protein